MKTPQFTAALQAEVQRLAKQLQAPPLPVLLCGDRGDLRTNLYRLPGEYDFPLFGDSGVRVARCLGDEVPLYLPVHIDTEAPIEADRVQQPDRQSGFLSMEKATRALLEQVALERVLAGKPKAGPFVDTSGYRRQVVPDRWIPRGDLSACVVLEAQRRCQADLFGGQTATVQKELDRFFKKERKGSR